MITVRRDTGFTLVEVMVSLVVFLVASMGLLPLLLTHMQANQGLNLHARARRLAGEVMAELQVIDYGRLGALTGTPLHEGDFEIRQRIDSDGLPDGQSRITVTAHWLHQDRPHRYPLQTVRSTP
jgi:prepilin-type N-terminal cleavage/methylation domain-containing protein